MDSRPSAAMKAVGAPPAQVRHRPHLTRQVKPAVATAKSEPAASRAPAPREASAVRPQPERTTIVATASPVPEPKASSNMASAEPAQHPEQKSDLAAFQSSSAGNPDLLVAILMARPDTRSIADLGGKTIAIDDRYSVSGGTVRTAIVAAGAAQVQLSEGQGTAMNRLSDGEVPAAVVALVTPEAADKFPEFLGYRIFKVPLSPFSPRARP
jgi:ABC-type amino acid transport substrate-binding protein